MPTLTWRARATTAAALGLVLLVAACGDNGTETSAPTTTAATAAGGVTTTAAADQPIPEGRGIVTTNPDGTRTVRSAYGTATVPAEPKRIVSVIGDIDFEAMLALGVKPVGAGTQGGTTASGFAPHLAGKTDGVERLAWADGAPVEAIAKLRPDLIFAPSAKTADSLKGIAPVVPRGSWEGTQWKDDFRYVADVLGRRPAADRLLADHESKAAALQTRLQAVTAGKKVLSAQVAHDHAQVYVDADSSFSGAVLTELGLTLDEPAMRDDKDGIAVSFENLGQLDTDVLFWQVRQSDDGAPDRAGIDKLKGNPLFARLPAVAAGRFHEVANRPWYFPTILGASQILADVEKALL